MNAFVDHMVILLQNSFLMTMKKNRSKGTNGVKFELDIEKLTLSDTKMK